MNSRPFTKEKAIPAPSDPDPESTSNANDPLGQFIQQQRDMHEEFAEAFDRDAEEEPAPSRILEELVRSRRKLDQMQAEISVVRKRMFAGNLITFIVAVSLVTLLVLNFRGGNPPLFNRGANEIAATPQSNDPGSEASTLTGTENKTDPSASQTNAMETAPKIDPRFMSRIHDLYSQARRFGSQEIDALSGDITTRTQVNEEYLHFMTSLSEISEQASVENASLETRMAIVNIATVAQDIRKTQGEVSLETKKLMRQIEEAIYPTGQSRRRRF
ncbi:MAG: hypothetical protein ACR2NZ_06470 [Rubripirellula sp.]